MTVQNLLKIDPEKGKQISSENVMTEKLQSFVLGIGGGIAPQGDASCWAVRSPANREERTGIDSLIYLD